MPLLKKWDNVIYENEIWTLFRDPFEDEFDGTPWRLYYLQRTLPGGGGGTEFVSHIPESKITPISPALYLKAIAQRDDLLDLVSKIAGSMALERVERFDLQEKANVLLAVK